MKKKKKKKKNGAIDLDDCRLGKIDMRRYLCLPFLMATASGREIA
jgi:hypothetical protein